MPMANVKSILPKIYASLLILSGLANTLYLLANFGNISFLTSPKWLAILTWCDTAALVTGLALFKTPLNFVIGYGLLRSRPWARYGVLAGLATLPLLISTELLWWEQYRLTYPWLLFLLVTTAATLVLFTRPRVKGIYDNGRQFRMVSWPGLLAGGVVLLACAPLLFTVSCKQMFWKMAMAPEIRQVTLSPPPSPVAGLVQIRLLDSSLPVFADSHLMHYDRIGFTRNPWRFSFKGPGGFIEYRNASDYENAFENFPFFTARGFELEKFFVTNNWNPLVLTLRSIARGQFAKYDVQEVRSADAHGFVTLLDDSMKKGRRKLFATFSLYEKNGNRCCNGMAIILTGPGPDADRVLNALISSMRFLNPEEPEAAATHYRQGTELLRAGRKLEGQVELANAFYLLPDRKDFRETFEATLSLPARELPHTLDEVEVKRE